MNPPLPYEMNKDEGTRMVHLFLRHKGIIAQNPDLKLYVSPSFLAFLRTRLNVSRCKTLTGRVVDRMFRVDAVDLHVDKNSPICFYISY